jgi:hypothetical protein
MEERNLDRGFQSVYEWQSRINWRMFFTLSRSQIVFTSRSVLGLERTRAPENGTSPPVLYPWGISAGLLWECPRIMNKSCPLWW